MNPTQTEGLWPTDLSPATMRQRRVLVVEDDRDLSTAVMRIARGVGPSVYVDWVCNAEDARERLAAAYYEIVLVDQYLEGSERGSSLIDKCWDRYPTTTFAMMSALELSKLVTLAERELPLGISILPKPFTAPEMRIFLQRLFEEHTKGKWS